MSIKKPIGNALEWWLKKQGMFDGAVVSTREGEIITSLPNGTSIKGDGTFHISQWNVPGIPQPTDEEIENIVDQYEVWKDDQEKIDEENLKKIEKELIQMGFSETTINFIKQRRR